MDMTGRAGAKAAAGAFDAGYAVEGGEFHEVGFAVGIDGLTAAVLEDEGDGGHVRRRACRLPACRRA